MMYRNVVCFLFVMCTAICRSEDLGVRSHYNMPEMPPTTLSLMAQEHQAKELEQLENIEKLVKRAVVDQSDKDRKRRAKSKQGKKAPKHERPLVLEKKEVVADHEVYAALAEQYKNPELIKKNITINLKNVEIKQAIGLLSKLSSIKILVDSDVEGKVPAFDFNDISLGSALNILLNNHVPRLALIKDVGVWRVVRAGVAAGIMAMRLRVAGKRSLQSVCVTMYNARWDAAFKTRVENLWQGIVGKEAGKNGEYLVFDDEGRKIFLRASKQQSDDLKLCLSEIDKKIPQVRLEARVVLAEKDFEDAIGFDWSGIYDRRASLKHTGFAGLGIGATNPANPNDPFRTLFPWSLNFIPTNLIGGFNLKLPFIFGNRTLETKRLNLLLNAAENRNEVKTILKPTLLIKSEETAEILVGEEMPQEIRLQETVEGQPTNVNTINYKDIGMKISVKPVVSPDHQSVFLDVFIENSMVSQPTIPAEGVSAPNGVRTTFNYTIRTSRSKSRVLLSSGQTTLIGGLIEERNEKSQTGVPVLQEIPFFGWFFRGRRTAKVDKQLLIFLTPTLV
ncbi:type II and III secretion system protein [Candidatus Babeliales bacterium]|nr:type II and III secretion system protein [Candidatus Babeliales bacterium]